MDTPEVIIRALASEHTKLVYSNAEGSPTSQRFILISIGIIDMLRGFFALFAPQAFHDRQRRA